MAKVLEILTHYHPRAIGLDLYRDTPVPPGSKELEVILTKNHNIITAMKFGGAEKIGIPPPPVLKIPIELALMTSSSTQVVLSAAVTFFG